MTDLFRVPLRETPWPRGKHSPEICRVCGLTWVPWPGSRLQCHGRCLFTDEGARRVVQWFREKPTGGMDRLADELGVSVNIVRACLHAHGVRMR